MKEELLVLALSSCILFYTLSVLLPLENEEEFNSDFKNINGMYVIYLSKIKLSKEL